MARSSIRSVITGRATLNALFNLALILRDYYPVVLAGERCIFAPLPLQSGCPLSSTVPSHGFTRKFIEHVTSDSVLQAFDLKTFVLNRVQDF